MKRRLLQQPMLSGFFGLAALLVIASAIASRSAQAAFPPEPSAPLQPPRVTMISDSVAATLLWHPNARAYLGEGLDFRLEALACRRLAVPGCYAYGSNPPSALETIRTLGTEASARSSSSTSATTTRRTSTQKELTSSCKRSSTRTSSAPSG